MAKPARQYHTQQTHYLRKNVTFADDGTAVTVGVLPEGSVIVAAGAVVSTAFNDSGTDLLDIGISGGDVDGIAANIDISSVGLKAGTVSGSDDLGPFSADVTVIAQFDGASGNADAGSAEVIVEYVADNDG